MRSVAGIVIVSVAGDFAPAGPVNENRPADELELSARRTPPTGAGCEVHGQARDRHARNRVKLTSDRSDTPGVGVKRRGLRQVLHERYPVVCEPWGVAVTQARHKRCCAGGEPTQRTCGKRRRSGKDRLRIVGVRVDPDARNMLGIQVGDRAVDRRGVERRRREPRIRGFHVQPPLQGSWVRRQAHHRVRERRVGALCRVPPVVVCARRRCGRALRLGEHAFLGTALRGRPSRGRRPRTIRVEIDLRSAPRPVQFTLQARVRRVRASIIDSDDPNRRTAWERLSVS